jgi:hypothetical protein
MLGAGAGVRDLCFEGSRPAAAVGAGRAPAAAGRTCACCAVVSQHDATIESFHVLLAYHSSLLRGRLAHACDA